MEPDPIEIAVTFHQFHILVVPLLYRASSPGVAGSPGAALAGLATESVAVGQVGETPGLISPKPTCYHCTPVWARCAVTVFIHPR